MGGDIMATQFQIKKGLSTDLFDSQGNCRLIKKVEGCWYLTIDTAEVFVCVRSIPGDEASDLVLKRLNELGDFSDYYTKVELDDILANVNAAMADIKATAEEAIAAAQAAQEAVDELADGRVTDLETRVDALEARAEELETRADTLEARTEALETRTDALEDRTDALEVTVGVHTESINELAAKIEDIGNFTDILENETIVTINNKLTALEKADIQITNAVTELEGAYDRLADIVDTKADADKVYTKTESDSIFIKVSEFNTKVDARVNTLIDGANSEDTITNVTNLVEFVNENAGDIAALITSVNTHSEAIGVLQTDVATNKATIEAAEATIAAHTESIAANTAAIAANKAAHEAAIQALDEKIEASRPKSSDEITVAPDGTISIAQMSTDKLVQGGDLILDGGNSTN
jgi:chromosome segregation ATPase